ncbi:glycosyltransferase family 4 protein [Nonomuraea basaltis]|uniref:glycosyltransferase family 4 protein n=1 Tax=Nonomuraea basaltis TaxID=2495887 RepID=UPI00110C5C3C|nr:glycosyltransferase family 4 protein [Nonomuraea basaltis]TMS00185.1 glycosyltransferase family 4 protein [Nonomuraea basaltis]
MRVLAMLHLYPPAGNAGAEWAMHTLLAALVTAGHDVDVLMIEPHREMSEPYTLDGVRVHPRRGKGDPFEWLLSDRAPHVIVTHLMNTPRATVLGEMYGIPVVHVLHNDHDHERSWLVRGPDLVVYNSEWVQRSCLDWWKDTQTGTPPPGVVVRPPVIAEDYATEPGDRVTLINMCENKGARLFWALAKRMPKMRFLAVKGAYGAQIVQDLPNVDVQEHVPGGQMREQVYARTRVLLVPSSYESWGRVAAEAMASGIPVVAHPTPGLLESCGDAGIFCDRDDIDAWERQIRRLSKHLAWKSASAKALARSRELDPSADLDRWVSAIQTVAKG